MSKDEDNHRKWLHIPTRGHLGRGQPDDSSSPTMPTSLFEPVKQQPPDKSELQPIKPLEENTIQTAPNRQESQPAATPAPQAPAAGVEQTAALARAQAEKIYATNPPHQPAESEPRSEPGQIPATYARSHQTQNGGFYDLRQYHIAWQDYYQKYYQGYYQQQLQIQQQKQLAEQAKNTKKAPAAATSATVTGGPGHAPSAEVRNKLLAKVSERSKKMRGSSHFMPIATAVVVGLIFFGLQFNKLISAQVNAYVSPSQTISDNVIVDPNASAEVGKEPRLIIPKINVDVPIVLGLESLDNASTQKALENGVVHYPIPGANSLPGQTGNNVILGHSSNDVFAPGDYKFAFVLLERLSSGDLFYIHYEGKRYVYRVTEKKVIQPTEINALVKPNTKPLTTLVTCTPIGTDEQRLLVSAEQISPDPSKAEKVDASAGVEEDVDLPGNQSSILQRLFRF